GPFRTRERLERAIVRIGDLAGELGERPFGDGRCFDMRRVDWFDLRNMLLVARAVAVAALRRTESRGAHQREDFPGMLPEWRVNQLVRLTDGRMAISSVPVNLSSPPQLAGEVDARSASGGGSSISHQPPPRPSPVMSETATLKIW